VTHHSHANPYISVLAGRESIFTEITEHNLISLI